jgi:hypothetical protein
MTKTEYQSICKTNQKAVDFTYNQIETDADGFPSYEIQYLNAPTNYKLVRLFDADKIAILEDLSPQTTA